MQISRFCGYSQKFSPCGEIWGQCLLVAPVNMQSMKVFSAKILFSTNSQKFSPVKFSCYTVLLIHILIFCYQQLSLPLVRISTHFSNASLLNTTPALPTPNNASWITRGRPRREGSAPDYVIAIKVWIYLQ